MAEVATEAIEIEHHEMQSFSGVEPQLNIHIHHGHGSFLSNLSVSSCVISYSSFARTLVYIFLLVTSVLVVAGGVFTGIFLKDKNYNGVVVAFFATCLSLGTASLFIMHLFRKLEKYHDSNTLEGLKILGMIMSVGSGISLGVYTILAFINKQAFNLNGINYFSSGVFSGVCLTTSIELYIVAQYYQNALESQAALGTINKR